MCEEIIAFDCHRIAGLLQDKAPNRQLLNKGISFSTDWNLSRYLFLETCTVQTRKVHFQSTVLRQSKDWTNKHNTVQ